MIREFEEAVKQIRARFVPDRELTQRLIAVAQRVIDDWVEIKRLEDNTMRRFANAPPSDDGHEEIESENQETKMKAQKINNEWIQIGCFAAKTGLITTLWLNYRDTNYQWDPVLKQNVAIPVKNWTLMAAVKNSGSHFACATFVDEAQAHEALEEALKLV